MRPFGLTCGVVCGLSTCVWCWEVAKRCEGGGEDVYSVYMIVYACKYVCVCVLFVYMCGAVRRWRNDQFES